MIWWAPNGLTPTQGLLPNGPEINPVARRTIVLKLT